MEQRQRVKRGTHSPRVTVEITPEIIEAAKRRDSGHCMIAEAIKRVVPGASGVSVDLATIRWTDREKGLRYIYLTPRIGQLSLLQFDQGDNEIEPFSFQLRTATVIRAATKRVAEDVPTRATVQATESQKAAKQGGRPERIGGVAPPVGPLSNSAKVKVGKRREFGLRSMSR